MTGAGASGGLPGGTRGRALALALLGLALLALWLAAAQPLLSLYAGRSARLEQRRTLLAHLRAAADGLPALRQRAAARPAAPAEPALPGDSDALAAAALQQAFGRLAEAAGVAPTSLETTPATPQDGFRRVGLRVNVSATWPVLVGLLAAIEDAAPTMLVTDLRLQGSVAHAATLPLTAAFTVAGFRTVSRPGGAAR